MDACATRHIYGLESSGRSVVTVCLALASLQTDRVVYAMSATNVPDGVISPMTSTDMANGIVGTVTTTDVTCTVIRAATPTTAGTVCT
jgi:hypothetical protein